MMATPSLSNCGRPLQTASVKKGLIKLEKKPNQGKTTYSATDHLHDVQIRVFLRGAVLEQLNTLKDNSMCSCESSVDSDVDIGKSARTQVYPDSKSLKV